jgi:hypothetical protein
MLIYQEMNQGHCFNANFIQNLNALVVSTPKFHQTLTQKNNAMKFVLCSDSDQEDNTH